MFGIMLRRRMAMAAARWELMARAPAAAL